MRNATFVSRNEPLEGADTMTLNTRAIGFDLTDAIRRHVESRLGAALSPFAGRFLRVTTRLDDVNANRGGIDKRCSAIVTLPGRAPVLAEATHEDLYTAIDEVAARIRRSLKRIVKRGMRLRRRPRRVAAPATI
jgi:putative sigma-54 modulation protein